MRLLIRVFPEIGVRGLSEKIKETPLKVSYEILLELAKESSVFHNGSE